MAGKEPVKKSGSNSDGGNEHKKMKRRCTFKTKRKLGVLNVSGLCKNTSLNSSVMRRTLSSNNRALARALELKKAELTAAVTLITSLRTENHALQAEVNRLQSCNGMSSDSLEQEVNLRVQKKMRIVQEALQQMGSSMMTVVKQIQILMDSTNGTETTNCRHPAVPHVSVAEPCPQPTVSQLASNLVRASRVSPSAVAEEDDSEDIDEYADKVAGLQSNEQTAVDVPVSFTHNQCNLSMIMEQSYSELELSICNTIESGRESALVPQRHSGQSNRRNAMVFRLADDDNENRYMLDNGPDDCHVISSKRTSRSRSKSSSVRRRRSSRLSRESSTESQTVNSDIDDTASEVGAAEHTPLSGLSSVAPDVTGEGHTLDLAENTNVAAVVKSKTNQERSNKNRRSSVAAVMESDDFNCNKVNVGEANDCGSPFKSPTTVSKESLKRGDIPKFISFDDAIANINGRSKSRNLKIEPRNVNDVNGKRSKKVVAGQQKPPHSANKVADNSSVGQVNELLQNGDHIGKSRSRRMTYVIDDAVDTQDAASLKEKVSMDDTLSCLNDLLGQSCDVLLDVSGCDGIGLLGDYTLHEMFPVNETLDSTLQGGLIIKSKRQSSAFSSQPHSVTQASMLDMEMTAIFQDSILVNEMEGDSVTTDTRTNVPVSDKPDHSQTQPEATLHPEENAVRPKTRRSTGRPSSIAKVTDARLSECSKSDNTEALKTKKLVTMYMSKPGNIVFNAASRRSSTDDAGKSKHSRSKSRSTLPVHTKPRSKQLLGTSTAVVGSSQSPASVFSFDGTPKDEADRRRAFSKQSTVSNEESFVEPPAKKKPVNPRRQTVGATCPARSASSSSVSSTAGEEDISSSPHGIMLRLANGQRTKPRRARSKTVRYAGAEVAIGPAGVATFASVETIQAEAVSSDVPSTPKAENMGPAANMTSPTVTVQNVRYSVPESPLDMLPLSSKSPIRASLHTSELTDEGDITSEREPWETVKSSDSLEVEKRKRAEKRKALSCIDVGNDGVEEVASKLEKRQNQDQLNCKSELNGDQDLTVQSKQVVSDNEESVIHLKRKKCKRPLVVDDAGSEEDVFISPRAKVPSSQQAAAEVQYNEHNPRHVHSKANKGSRQKRSKERRSSQIDSNQCLVAEVFVPKQKASISIDNRLPEIETRGRDKEVPVSKHKSSKTAESKEPEIETHGRDKDVPVSKHKSSKTAESKEPEFETHGHDKEVPVSKPKSSKTAESKEPEIETHGRDKEMPVSKPKSSKTAESKEPEIEAHGHDKEVPVSKPKSSKTAERKEPEIETHVRDKEIPVSKNKSTKTADCKIPENVSQDEEMHVAKRKSNMSTDTRIPKIAILPHEKDMQFSKHMSKVVNNSTESDAQAQGKVMHVSKLKLKAAGVSVLPPKNDACTKDKEILVAKQKLSMATDSEVPENDSHGRESHVTKSKSSNRNSKGHQKENVESEKWNRVTGDGGASKLIGEEACVDSKAKHQNNPLDAVQHASSRLSHGIDDGTRSRRAATAVSYKEPPLGSKLRQGDKFTSTIYKGHESDKERETAVVKQQPAKKKHLLKAIGILNVLGVGESK